MLHVHDYTPLYIAYEPGLVNPELARVARLNGTATPMGDIVAVAYCPCGHQHIIPWAADLDGAW